MTLTGDWIILLGLSGGLRKDDSEPAKDSALSLHQLLKYMHSQVKMPINVTEVPSGGVG